MYVVELSYIDGTMLSAGHEIVLIHVTVTSLAINFSLFKRAVSLSLSHTQTHTHTHTHIQRHDAEQFHCDHSNHIFHDICKHVGSFNPIKATQLAQSTHTKIVINHLLLCLTPVPLFLFFYLLP